MSMTPLLYLRLFVCLFICSFVRWLVEYIAGTAGLGDVLHNQRVVRLYLLLAACMSA